MRFWRGRQNYNVNKFPYGSLEYVGGDIKAVKEFFMNKKLIFLVLLVCLLAVVAVVAFGQNSPSVRWEYNFVAGGSLETANKLGQEGWELVTVTGTSSINNMLFKRRLP
jgi:hypothetical protein